MNVSILPSALIPCAAALAVAMALMPLCRRLADRKGWYDPPGLRKIHSRNITHLGGAAMFAAFALTVVVAASVLRLFTWRLAVLLAGAGVLFVLGMADDFRDLRALPRLVIHFVVAAAVAGSGLVIRSIWLPGAGTVELGAAGYVLTALWIAAVVNAVNWSDGLDGYAGGICAVAALVLGVLGLLEGRVLTAMVGLALFGTLVGYLAFNFPPARIFMGDAGATFVAFTLAVLPVLEPEAAAEGRAIVAAVLVLVIPLVEFVTSIIRRVGEGRHPGAPDRGHIHYKLRDMGWSPRRILAVVYPMCLLFGAAVLTGLGPWNGVRTAIRGSALLAVPVVALGFTWWVFARRARNAPPPAREQARERTRGEDSVG